MHKQTMRGQPRTKPERLQVVDIKWWAFDEYELKNVYIRPVAGAKLSEYDPWKVYERSKGDTGVQPPYVELLRLNSRIGRPFPLRFDSGVAALRPGSHSIQLPPKDKDCLLEWCAHYGLLGILPHKFHSATLAARWGEVGRQSPVAAVVKQFSRVGGEWRSRQTPFLGESIIPQELIGGLVPKEKLPYGCPEAGADGFRDGPIGAGWVHEHLGETWGRFFPSVEPRKRDEFDYPCPLTTEFWNVYSEPIDTFLGYVSIFDWATRCLQPRAEFDRGWEEQAARSYLQTLLAPAAQIPIQTRGQVELKWRFPSLLSALMQMACQDALAGRYRLQCGSCHLPFVSDAYQARYCSEQCRYKQQKRDLRARMKQAQEMLAAGNRAKVIDQQMN